MSKEPNLTIKPVGIMNRRDKANEGDFKQVLWRQNFRVIGIGEAMKNVKLPGSDRYTTSAISESPVVWGHRYYTSGNFARTFAFAGGVLSYIDNYGTKTEIINTFLPTAYPCSEIFKVSGNDLLLFSAGDGTGMYSYDGNLTPTFQKQNQVTLNFAGFLSHLDRIFGFEEGSDNLYFSVNLDPFDYTNSTDAGVITIGAGRGSKIMGLALLNETLYIFKQDSIWILEGRTPSEFSVRQVVTDLGVAARRSIKKGKLTNSIFFLGSNFEFYNFDGTNLKLLSYNICIGGDYTKNLPSIINLDRMDQVVADFHDNLYRCSFVETEQTVAKMEWCFDTTNQTDFFTRGNNVACYIKYDRYPDKNELLTGRSDNGYLMYQHRGLNWDNQAASVETPTMPLLLRTKFVGEKKPVNMRFKYAWVDAEVMGAEPIPINYFIDSRIAGSDARTDQWQMRGEYKSPTNFININSQSDVTDRQVLKHSGSKGVSIQFEINIDKYNLDFGFSNIHVLAIEKNAKRNVKVAA